MTQPNGPSGSTILAQVRELVAVVRFSDNPYARRRDLVLAVTELLRMDWQTPTAGLEQPPASDEASNLLRSVLATLIALTEPEHQNQTVLLVKA